MKNWKNVMEKHSNEITLLGIFIILFVIFSVASPDKFLTQTNLKTMMFQMPEFGLMAIAMMITILTGGINLSITNGAALASIVAAFVLVSPFAKGNSIAWELIKLHLVVLHWGFPYYVEWQIGVDNSLHRSCTNVG